MLRLLVFFLVFVGAVGFILYQLLSFGLFMKSGRGQTAKDIEDLKDMLQDLRSQLVPFNENELSLLSLSQSSRSVKRGIHNTSVGVFDSIYHEPLIAYAYKDYMGSDKALMVAMTNRNEWIYDIAEGATEVFLNGKPVGHIGPDGTLRGKESNRALAHIDVDQRVSSYPVYVGSREIGHVANPNMVTDVNPRAFHLYGDLEADEEDLFLSLSILSMVETTL